MGARKYGRDAFGSWDRDAASLPRYALGPAQLPRTCPPLLHAISTGRLTLLGDSRGRVQVFTAEPGMATSLNCEGPHFANALGLCVTAGDRAGQFLLGDMPGEATPAAFFGVGSLGYTGVVNPGSDTRVSCTLEFLAPWGATFFLVGLRLENNTDAPLSIDVILTSDLNPEPVEAFPPQRRTFAKDGVALSADLHPQLGDFFLAGEAGWRPRAEPTRLQLETSLQLTPGTPWQAKLLLGCSHSCSMDWLRQQLEMWTEEKARAHWTDILGRTKFRVPELWMQEECLWDVGRLLAFTVWSPGTGEVMLSPGGDALFSPGFPSIVPRPGPAIRDVLALTLPLNGWVPELALVNLRGAMAAQLPSGRLPEVLGAPCAADLDTVGDRSDNEIWLLVAWAEHLAVATGTTVLDQLCPFADGSIAPAWEHIRRAYQWVRDEIHEGARGLVRMLAGDWCGYLNRVGVGGRGESVLNSAMLCYALQRLADVARRREEQALADEMTTWLQNLRRAVGDAFDGRHFRRAYTDAGRPVGTQIEDRFYTDIQAWALLARCGTAAQREAACQSVLDHLAGGGALSVMSRPYASPPPPDISDLPVSPGEADNAGVSLPVAAWFVWALAAEGHNTRALHEWERLTIRRRSAESADLSAALVANIASPASPHAGRRAGLALLPPGAVTWLPSAHAVAWQPFALRKALG